MIPEKIKKVLKKQHYSIVGKHSAVQVCRWTKKSLTNEGVCYKEQFYGIKSHLCCQMSPAVMWCPNRCLHCWRAVELTIDNELKGKVDSPKDIIDGCVKSQRILLTGFKGKNKIDMKKFKEAQEPMQFAISLSGEPMVYEHIGGVIEELRRRGKTSFLVTNGLYPEKLRELEKKKQLPTQLYISVNAPNKEIYEKIHRSSKKDAWEKLNESLELMAKLRKKTRTVFRMNLILDMNMTEEKEYAEMIKKANPMFVEVKAFMCVGFSQNRIPYNKMPYQEDIVDFSKKILKFLPEYKILDEKKESRVLLLGKDKKDMKIKEKEI
jgi:tRNA wybutosine-synthesizing protein 1